MAQKTSRQTADKITPIMMELARTELAALTAGLKFWGGWVVSADKYTRGISSELNRVSAKSGNTSDFVGRLTDLTRTFLREIADLPNIATKHFVDEVEHTRTPSKRTRRARAKA